MFLLLWALVGEGAAGAGAGGGGGEDAAAAYGGGRAAQGATRPYLGGLADGAAGVTILVQLDDIDIPLSCTEGGGGAGDGVAAIGGLNEGIAIFKVFSAYGFGPLEVSISIQLDDIDIVSSCAEGGGGFAGDGVAAIGGLNEGEARLTLRSADGFGPLEVTTGIQLDDIDIQHSCAEGVGVVGDGVAAIGGLNEGAAPVILWSADGFGPLEVTIGIQLDDIDIGLSCAGGFGLAGDGVAAIGGLNEGAVLLTRWSADSLTEGGGGASGKDGIKGRGGLGVRILRWRIRAGRCLVARILRWQRSGDKKR